MVFYKIEFISGTVLTVFGIISLVLVILASQLLSLFIIIPLIFLIGGIYLITLAFKQVELEESDIPKGEYKIKD